MIDRRLLRASAFTLIELLVVISILALLVAILLPSLRKAREQAKETVCSTYLGSFGRGFVVYANVYKDRLCSGSFDPDVDNGRDGSVDKVGWVADLLNMDLAEPGKMLCPSNPAKFNQKLGQGPSSGFYTPEEAQDLIDRGYNSNYTQAWYMARTEARWPNPEGDTNWKRVASTKGPLMTARMSQANPSRVPLMGDGGIEGSDTIQGELTVKTMTDGPFGGGPYAIQDYSDFGPAHGYGKRIVAGLKSSERDRSNILFGDGHVGKFIDKVRNGEFRLSTPTPDTPHYSQEDLGPEVFDGVLSLGRRSLDDYQIR